ncbi:MAG: ribokinase [Flavitalea sp.]
MFNLSAISQAPVITVIGSSNMDMVISAPHIPAPGETILGSDFEMLPGGKGANQAVTIARLTNQVNFITNLGSDSMGKELINVYDREKMNMSLISEDSSTSTGVALITIDRKGENCIVVSPGANGLLSSSMIDQHLDVIIGSGMIVTQMEIPVATIKHLLTISKDHNKKLLLNPAPAEHIASLDLEGLFLLTPNRGEASLITEVELNNETGYLKAATKLRDRGIQNVVITLGKEGAFVCCDDFTGIVDSFEAEVVDTTGAGDVFNGAIAVALNSGIKINEAVSFANRAASIAVGKKGAQTAIPTLGQISVYYR